ncbi:MULTISPECIES: DUF3078 domain-containing protein [unclassified Flavobacterium]|uniref:DUF3078 domain-containing protein n=1 Tax=unclassified Flavobacterium TaxID=196869 RepID=UPI001F142799|nr:MULTISPECIES: DUF3078 domain-containing protein [unclassified Flavobacterium]UMY66078.1 DUF3078 domain-containing protein [Flavobacterium sp. HJ-32-4]
MRTFLFFLLLGSPILLFSQTRDTIVTVEKKVSVKVPDVVSPWQKKNSIGFDVNEIAFVNWNAGGVSSISGLLKTNFSRIYTKRNIKWGNELIMRYGLNKQDGIEVRKTDDAVQLNSTVGYRRDTLSNWFHSAKFTFSTQFSNGYNYPDKSHPISRAFAPAYTFLGIGAEYSNKEKKVNIYLSPLTMKNTLVLDQRLADLGTFGVDKAVYDADGNRIRRGKRSRTELGTLVSTHFKATVAKNITYENRLSLYTDYLNRFGNIDTDWQGTLDLVVNEYIRANIGFHVIYDDDIKANEERDGKQVQVGPKIQLKQMLGIGAVYNF